MKKYLIIMLILSLVPLGLKAQSLKEIQDACDNQLWLEQRYVYSYVMNYNQNKKPGDDPLTEKDLQYTEDYMKYMIGEYDDRTKYNDDAVRYCVENKGRYCPWGVFPVRCFGNRMLVNYPTAALTVNNKRLFESLIDLYPYLLDNSLVDYDNYHYNDYFLTPALFAIRNGQFGIVKYLVDKYQVNLLRKSGYIYHDQSKPQDLIDAKQLAQEMVDIWRANGNEKGLTCALKTQEFVEEWFREHQRDPKYNNQELLEYNNEVKRIAGLPKHRAENQIFIEYESKPVLLLDMQEKYAEMKEIERQINNMEIQIMIDKLMRDIDFSFLGNQA